MYLTHVQLILYEWIKWAGHILTFETSKSLYQKKKKLLNETTCTIIDLEKVAFSILL